LLMEKKSLLDYLDGPVRNYFRGHLLVEWVEPWPFGEWDHSKAGSSRGIRRDAGRFRRGRDRAVPAPSSPQESERPLAVSVRQRQVGRPPASAAQDNHLLLEQEILRDHPSHASGTTQLRGHDD
jgi:hypothetical protein